MRKWAFALSTDALIFGHFYLWKIQGIEGARSFLAFILWFTASLMVIAALFGDFKVRRRNPVTLYTFYAYGTSMATIGLAVYTGMVAMAITYFIGWVICQSRIPSEKEPA